MGIQQKKHERKQGSEIAHTKQSKGTKERERERVHVREGESITSLPERSKDSLDSVADGLLGCPRWIKGTQLLHHFAHVFRACGALFLDDSSYFVLDLLLCHCFRQIHLKHVDLFLLLFGLLRSSSGLVVGDRLFTPFDGLLDQDLDHRVGDLGRCLRRLFEVCQVAQDTLIPVRLKDEISMPVKRRSNRNRSSRIDSQRVTLTTASLCLSLERIASLTSALIWRSNWGLEGTATEQQCTTC